MAGHRAAAESDAAAGGERLDFLAPHVAAPPERPRGPLADSRAAHPRPLLRGVGARRARRPRAAGGGRRPLWDRRRRARPVLRAAGRQGDPDRRDRAPLQRPPSAGLRGGSDAAGRLRRALAAGDRGGGARGRGSARLAPQARMAAMDRLEERLAPLPRVHPLKADDLFRVDAASGMEIALPERVRADLEVPLRRCARLLAALYPERAFRAAWAERFLSRHPADTDVPLLDLYHGLFEPGEPERPGAFPPAPAGAAEAAAVFARTREWFAARARAAGEAGSEEVALGEEDWETLLDGLPPEPAWSAGALFQIAAGSPRGDREGGVPDGAERPLRCRHRARPFRPSARRSGRGQPRRPRGAAAAGSRWSGRERCSPRSPTTISAGAPTPACGRACFPTRSSCRARRRARAPR